MASDKQIGFITKLITTKYVPEQATAMLEAMPWDQLDNKQASAVIEKLMKQPNLPDPTVPEVVAAEARHGSNSSQGACASCGHVVAPNAGFYFGPFPTGSRWKTHHKVGECSSEPAPQPGKGEEGWYKVGDRLLQVYTTRNGRLAGKELDGNGKMTYAPGAAQTASTGERIIGEEAGALICLATYGALPGTEELARIALSHAHAHSACMFCSLPLTDERSDPNQGGKGYGPVCAGKYGLPWG